MEKICKKCYKFFTPVTDGYLDQRYCSDKCKRGKRDLTGIERKVREIKEVKKPVGDMFPAARKEYKKREIIPFERSRWHSKYRKNPEQRYNQYWRSAINRGKEFDLSFEDFMTFWGKPCFYCNKGIDTIGLDRIDNTKGYTKDNVSSCCRICNCMKYSMSRETFLRHCVIITAIHGQFKLPEPVLESNIDDNDTSSTAPDSTSAK